MAVILVVEDEPIIGEIAVLMIEDLGHTTLLACDVDEALVFLRSTQPIDALFTDIRLKAAVHGGYELADQAIKLRPKLRVLYATGNSQTGAMKALFVEGGSFKSPIRSLSYKTPCKSCWQPSLSARSIP